MGKVHADDIETSSSELVDGLYGVCLWTDCANDGGTTIVLCRRDAVKRNVSVVNGGEYGDGWYAGGLDKGEDVSDGPRMKL